MTNPWKSRPVVICATPLVGLVAQIVILGLATIQNEDRSRGDHGVALFMVGMCVPLVSIPALVAAISESAKPKGRGWGVTGAVLNGAYLASILVFIAYFWLSGRERIVGTDNEPPALLARPTPEPPKP